MKRTITIWTAGILALCLLTGCQATPDEPVVLQKDLEQMIEKGMAEGRESPAPMAAKMDYAALCAHYGVPERFEKTITKGKLTISCDVNIELPETASLPMARVQAGRFSQERVTALFEALCGGTTMYVMPEQMDKEYFQQEILKKQAELAAQTDEQEIKFLNNWIADLKESYNKAPDKNELVPTDGTLQTEEMRENNIRESLGMHTVLRATSAPFQKDEMYFFVFNDVENATGIYSGKDEQGNTFTLAPSSTARLGFSREGMNTHYSGYWQGQILSDVTDASRTGGAAADGMLTTTPQQARDMAESFLGDMGLDDMVIDTVLLCSSERREYMTAVEGGYSSTSSPPGDEPERQAYVFRILRQLNGVKVESTHETSQTTMEVAQGDGNIAVGKEWAYEYMTIAVDDAGLAYLSWQGPLEVTEVLTQNTAIRPWDEIESVFEKMIVIKNAMYENIDAYKAVRIDITHAVLSLQRIMERDSYTTGLLVPVWNFFGTTTYVHADGNPMELQCGYTPLISINAIDGSVVDVSMGY